MGMTVKVEVALVNVEGTVVASMPLVCDVLVVGGVPRVIQALEGAYFHSVEKGPPLIEARVTLPPELESLHGTLKLPGIVEANGGDIVVKPIQVLLNYKDDDEPWQS